MSKVKDLDALVQGNKMVKLAGTEYTLPGDVPLETYLRLNVAMELEEESQAKAVEELVDTLGDLFSLLYPDPDKARIKGQVEAALRSRGVAFLMTLVQNIYGAEVADSPEEGDGGSEEVPTEAAGTPNT